MGLVIKNVTLSKNPVNVNEHFKITVFALDIPEEPIGYRLSFRLGAPKGSIGLAMEDIDATARKMPFKLGEPANDFKA